MILASATAFLFVAVKPEMVGAATTSVKTCSGGNIDLGVKEERTLVLHNETRADHGLEPLCINPVLTRAARSHSREMVEKDYFSHYSDDGEGGRRPSEALWLRLERLWREPRRGLRQPRRTRLHLRALDQQLAP